MEHIRIHKEMTGHGEGSGEGNHGMTRITMRVQDDSHAFVTADGRLHREMTCRIEENGVATEGKLVLDIAGLK